MLAWAALTLLTSTGTAHADEETDGPLDGLTSLVGSTVGAGTDLVSDVVTDTVTPAVEYVAPVVTETVPTAAEPVAQSVSQTVDAIPVVRDVVPPVVAPVADAATETATEVTAPVTQLLKDSPVSQVTDPVLDAVSDIHIVGDVLEDLSITDAATEISRTVDATAGVLGGAVEDAFPPVLETVDRAVPSGPDASAPEVDAADPSPMREPAMPAMDKTATSVSAGAATVAAVTAAISEADAAGESGVPARAAHLPPGSPAPSSSTGHGGPVGDAARPGDTSDDALRAWKHPLGATDDVLPCSPVFETDASPD